MVFGKIRKDPCVQRFFVQRGLQIDLGAVFSRLDVRKMSRRRAMKVARDVQIDGREIFEKLYTGYRVAEDIRVTYSDFMPGAYIYCRMRKRD